MSPIGAAIVHRHNVLFPYGPLPSDMMPPDTSADIAHGQVPAQLEPGPANNGGVYLPAAQVWHVELDLAPTSFEYFPAAQFRQVPTDTAPTTVEYLPSKHWTQSDTSSLPSVGKNVPDGQLLHADAMIAAVAVLYLPREHSVHEAEPFTSLYVPGIHAAHATPSGPVYPLLQLQLVSSPLPALEYV
jgi:hypothetical protein